MRAQLVYVTDIYCIWCFGFGPTLRRLVEGLGDKVDIEIVNGGMIPEDIKLSEMFGRFPDPLALHGRVAEMTGVEFGKPYLEEIRNFRSSRRVLNSMVPAQAMRAICRLGVRDQFAVLSAIQDLHYRDNKDLQDPESYRALTASLDVPFDSFSYLLADEHMRTGVRYEREGARSKGIEAYPTLLLRAPGDKLMMVAEGFVHFETLLANVERAYEQCGAKMPALRSA